MADDQNPKNTSIDDLVRELSKNSMNPTTPPPAHPQGPRPPFPMPKPPISPPMAGSPTVPPALITPKPLTPMNPTTPSVPRPQFNSPPPPKPIPIPSSPVPGSSTPTPSTTPGVKEYQSSIRTMNDDISRLKQGQKPAGVDIPRKVEQVTPLPQPMPPKPPIVPKVEPKPQIYVPQEGQKGGNRNMLFIGIGAVAVVAGFVYWFFMLRSPAPVIVQETPTPTLTPIATPVQDLSTIFSNGGAQDVKVKSTDPVSGLINAISSTATEPINVNGGSLIRLNITSETKGQVLLGLLDFLTEPKQELVDSFGQDSMVLLYGQKEIFDSKGTIKLGAPIEKRLVFVLEVNDSYSATQTLLAWETTMVEDLQKLLSLNVSKQKNPQFSDNTYSGSTIRYRNFLWPDKSIDYSIVAATNGKSYLVLAGSKESMFATIDKLKGL